MDDGQRSSAEPGWLLEEFEDHRGHLRAVAQRVLGSSADADDAVQEAWLRLSRSDADEITNLRGWLTTVVARISLDMLRSRAARRETHWAPDSSTVGDGTVTALTTATPDPAAEAELADSVGLALLVVLDTLSPTERLAFVLHDLFGLPFEEIAPVIDRSPAAARQLASRARRRVRSAEPSPAHGEPGTGSGTRAVVEAFLAASRGGDLSRLLELLAPGVVLRSDAAGVAMGSAPVVEGAPAVAETFSGRARAARLVLIDGRPAALWSMGGTPKVAFLFTVTDGRVAAIDLVADPRRLAALEVTEARD